MELNQQPAASNQPPALDPVVADTRAQAGGPRETWLTNAWFRMKSHGEAGSWELEAGSSEKPWA
jgi:hypothetical protein